MGDGLGGFIYMPDGYVGRCWTRKGEVGYYC